MIRHGKIVLCVAAVISALLLLPGFLLLVVVIAIVGGPLGGGGCGGDGGPGGGSQQIGPRNWSAEQTANAQLITSLVLARGLPRRAAVIAVSTAIVESGLRNIHAGDRDSLGLFQQRPSQGWGSPAQVLNPTGATTTFLNRLVAIPGWQTLPPGTAAQAVQRSGRPGAYAPQEAPAADLVARYWTGPDNPLAGLTQLAATGLAGLTGCPDQGASNLPLLSWPPGQLNPKTMPPGYQLPSDPQAHAALAYAISQLGKPYVWGATGPNSFDCSGLVQASWAAAGVPVSRSTATQVHDGTPVAGINQAQPGDLLFTPGDGGSAAHPGHVGLYAGSGLVIDAYDSTHGAIADELATWTPTIVAIRDASSPGSPTGRPSPSPEILAADRPGNRSFVITSIPRERTPMKPAALTMTVMLSASTALAIAGTAPAATPATAPPWVKTTAICPPGSEIDPQNSQQCRSLTPAGAETATAGCQSAGYSIDSRGSDYCVDSSGRDTLGNQH